MGKENRCAARLGTVPNPQIGLGAIVEVDITNRAIPVEPATSSTVLAASKLMCSDRHWISLLTKVNLHVGHVRDPFERLVLSLPNGEVLVRLEDGRVIAILRSGSLGIDEVIVLVKRSIILRKDQAEMQE